MFIKKYVAHLSGGYRAPTMFFALLFLYRCNYFLRNSVGACDPQCAGVLVGAEITTIFLESHLFTEVEWFWENGLLEIPTYFNKELVDCTRVPIFSKIGYSVGIFFLMGQFYFSDMKIIFDIFLTWKAKWQTSTWRIILP